ncbi:hypothetical protein [Geodermatophilus amargosae]|uniref:hypothetical protein n=1 Tax=Geodermatophilus amargosae TaxID=1296565 RepID=UPI001114FF0D|nr:hypothetical protein [Geodermatophilus amargosae]
MYYFGWSRAAATYRYFGIEIGLLDLSFQDHLLRSVRSTYFPLLAAGVLGFGVILLHRRIVDSMHAKALGLGLVIFGLLGMLVGLAAIVRLVTFRTAWPVVPADLLGSTTMIAYGAVVLGQALSPAKRETYSIPRAAWFVLAGVLLLLTIWLVSSYASYRGLQSATAIERDLDARPGVVLLSEQELHLRGTGLTAQDVESEDSAYRHCYSGLRYLIRSGSRHFLLPEYWQRGRDPIIVVHESDSIRFEYLPSTSPTTCE